MARALHPASRSNGRIQIVNVNEQPQNAHGHSGDTTQLREPRRSHRDGWVMPSGHDGPSLYVDEVERGAEWASSSRMRGSRTG
jgi:hypothetical protein